MIVAEQLFNGFNYGLLLFLIASGLSLVFGVMHLINLAHGSVFMVGAFVAAACASSLGSFLLSGMIATIACFATALVVERLIVSRLYGRSHLDQVLATFGLVLFLNELVRWLSGGTPLFVAPPSLLDGSVELVPGFSYSSYRLAIIAIAASVALAMWFCIARTKVGMLVRASAVNPAMVRHIGYDTRLVAMLVFAFGGALAGLAGVLVGPLISIEVGMGEQVLILAFVIVVIGGLGSIKGTFFAALAVGMIDTLGRAFIPSLLSGLLSARTVSSLAPALSATLVYLLMAAVLTTRPQGLFAK